MLILRILSSLDDILFKTENYDASIEYLEMLQLGLMSANLGVEELGREVRTALLSEHMESIKCIQSIVSVEEEVTGYEPLACSRWEWYIFDDCCFDFDVFA